MFKVVISPRVRLAILLGLLLALDPSPGSAETAAGARLDPFTPPQRVSFERRYNPGEAELKSRFLVGFQTVDSPEAVAALEERLKTVMGGKYRLHYYPPFYVIRDDGLPVPEGAAYLEHLDIPISLQLKDATVWDALIAWNGALNEALAEDGPTNRLDWRFFNAWSPQACFKDPSVTNDYQEAPARVVLHDILRQSPVLMSYSYYGGAEDRYAGQHSTTKVEFFDNAGNQVIHQHPDGAYHYHWNDFTRPDPNTPEDAPAEKESWRQARDSELNKHHNAKRAANSPPKPNKAEIERDRMAALFAEHAKKRSAESEADRRARDALAEEAKAAFESFFAVHMASGDYDMIGERLLIFGSRVEGLSDHQDWPGFKKHLADLIAPITAAYKREAFKIGTRDYDFARTVESDVLVRLRIRETEDLAKVFLEHIKGDQWEGRLKKSITVEESVGLFLLMRKIGDVWYWNPFGC